MQIADDKAYALLNYIDGVARHGYALSSDELERYAAGRGRRTLETGLMAQYKRSMAAATYWETGRPEQASAWLARLGWIVSAEALQLTELGRAVLRELKQQEEKEELPLDVTLAPDDPVAYARVIERIASHGDAMLVDAFSDSTIL